MLTGAGVNMGRVVLSAGQLTQIDPSFGGYPHELLAITDELMGTDSPQDNERAVAMLSRFDHLHSIGIEDPLASVIGMHEHAEPVASQEEQLKFH